MDVTQLRDLERMAFDFGVKHPHSIAIPHELMNLSEFVRRGQEAAQLKELQDKAYRWGLTHAEYAFIPTVYEPVREHALRGMKDGMRIHGVQDE